MSIFFYNYLPLIKSFFFSRGGETHDKKRLKITSHFSGPIKCPSNPAVKKEMPIKVDCLLFIGKSYSKLDFI